MAYRVIDVDTSPFDPRSAKSEAVAMANEIVAGQVVFVPKGGPKPAQHLILAAGMARRQRQMVHDGIKGTAYWAVPLHDDE